MSHLALLASPKVACLIQKAGVPPSLVMPTGARSIAGEIAD
jgi:hypothetical protein